ncbi:MAG: class I tRNA ligase family protein, partial [Desulfovibrionaceae bacterium]|nr:class I tRNA ligase family protein [Desulfovibrionaceae bacterium]
MSDYKSTLNLPATSFPMKANLASREPETLKYWDEIDAYAEMISSNQGAPVYCLHDGPPYANGHIHLGTAMNKIIKDIIIKARNMSGWLAEYVPGWDCHGLPIEHKVAQELRAKGKDLPPTAVRKICREYANKYLDIQRAEFRRLGVLGTWDDPYVTMKPEYESITTKELVKFMRSGSVVRNKKPIYWCASCQTALAEAEVENHDHHSDSIFVRFPLTDPNLLKVFPQADINNTYAVIWTTTPWTMPSNLAIMANPEFDYALVKADGSFYIVAEEMLDSLRPQLGWENAEVTATVKGRELERLKARHPFLNRESLLILADCVTLDAGTGLVHCAPGHGPDDYVAGQRYGLEVYSPLNDQGVYLDDVEFFAGMQVFDANPKVVEKLKEVGNLLASAKMGHSYPHCWRCKNPVIYRATTQWFILMGANDLRKKALSAIANDVNWIPGWGKDRIYNMIENRPDWCISRQRVWGVPIIALICESCDTAWNDPDWADAIADKYAEHPTGCDYWYETPVEELVPHGLTCP